MKVFVTGGTGFTGARVVSLLIKNRYQVRCLHRPTSDRSVLPYLEIEWVEGDLSDAHTLSASMRGSDVLINMVSLGLGHADSLVNAAQETRIQRAIFISTTAIFTQLNAKSKAVRLAAEQTIQNSGLQYTILRPTMIYGSPRDRNMWRLIRLMRVSPVVPVFGDGTYLQQPIYVNDVAQAVLSCLGSDQTVCKSYNVAGRQPLTYNQVIDTIARQMNKRVGKLHIPSKPVIFLLRCLEQLKIPFPIKSEQVLRLNEHKNFSYTEAQQDFGFHPISFAEGIAMELEG